MAASQSFTQILFQKEGNVGVITLNRPDRLNAWTAQMNYELTEAIEACNDDPGIGAMVVTGQGRGFCAGADIGDNFKARLDGKAPPPPPRKLPDWVALVRQSKPMIAAVNGASVGVGATMILPFDVIIASDRARFAMAFVKMGLVPELASSHFLVQRMGFGHASEMCLTGRLYSAEESAKLGLVDRVVPHDTLMTEALGLAREMAANPSPQLRWIKQLLTENGSDTDLNAVQRREIAALEKARVSPEHKEAVSAFLEKRTPNFTRQG
jgi:2-(1,2-epoxy-1,2-dihydrophenyl)acetyl-CoA isomerase